MMKPQQDLLKMFEDVVVTRNPGFLEEAFDEAVSSGLDMDPVLKALKDGLDRTLKQLRNHSTSIPEFLLSVDVMKQGLNKLKMLRSGNSIRSDKARIVIGVVEGDVHDLGKNIIAGVFEAYGYDVMDLGKNVPARLFIEEAKNAQAHILALSTMMSTPLKNMQEAIEWCKRDLPGVPILVGGATLDEKIAHSFGADGYAESAVTAPDELQRILGRSRPAA